MRGLTHLYYGSGKGKTTAAMGLALRCIGHGKKVVITQFLKNGASGECVALAKTDGVTILAANPTGKFSSQMSGEEKKLTRDAVNRTFDAATDFVFRENSGLLVLDEACAAVSLGFLDEEKLLRYIEQKPEGTELVITGREPTDKLMQAADYVTEMANRRHPYENGVKAREGIEF